MRTFRCLLPVAVSLLCCACAHAQIAVPVPTLATSWSALMMIRSGTAISVVRGHRYHCVLMSVTEAELVCEADPSSFFPRRPYVFSQSEVREVRLEHPLSSTLAGVVVGSGLGAAIGAANGSSTLTQGANEVIAGAMLGGIGGFVGRRLHLVHGAILYRK